MNIILFSRLDDCGLILRTILDVLPPSVCGIFRSGPSSTLQYCGRERRERSQTPMSLMLSSLKSFFYLLVTGFQLFLLPVLLGLSA